mmetsp:Transcript_11908/g.15010  ORF Transcript_11908/g.15010 Transcript_11908/m.15010 type:complete len:1134 (-) Transcript_11908:270-3671(-)
MMRNEQQKIQGSRKETNSRNMKRSSSFEYKHMKRKHAFSEAEESVQTSQSLDGFAFRKHFLAQAPLSTKSLGTGSGSLSFKSNGKIDLQGKQLRTLDNLTVVEKSSNDPTKAASHARPFQTLRNMLEEQSDSLCSLKDSPPRPVRKEAVGLSHPKRKSPELQRMGKAGSLYPRQKQPEKMQSSPKGAASSSLFSIKTHTRRRTPAGQESFDAQEEGKNGGGQSLGRLCQCNPSSSGVCICPHLKQDSKLNTTKEVSPVDGICQGTSSTKTESNTKRAALKALNKTLVQRPAGGGWRGDMTLDADPVASMCFGLTETVTSISATPDGCFVACGFESGAVRLFDMTVSGNTDPQDRLGCLMGHVPTVKGRPGGHLKTMAKVAGEGAHLFAGAGFGSKKLMAWDLGHFRRLRETRGFATALGIRSFECGDSKARGLADAALFSEEGGSYRYRVLCGTGFQRMHVFDAIFEKGKVSEENKNGIWSLIYSESVAAPMMTMGTLGKMGMCAVTKDGMGLRIWDLSKPFEKPTKYSKLVNSEEALATSFPDSKSMTAYSGSTSLLGRMAVTIGKSLGGSDSVSVKTDELGSSVMDAGEGFRSRRGRAGGNVRTVVTTEDGRYVLVTSSDGSVYLAYPSEEKIEVGFSRVKKPFATEGDMTIFYEGTVDSFGGQHYYISYDNGDSEHLTEAEVRQYLIKGSSFQQSVSKLFTLQSEAKVDIYSEIQHIRLPSASSSTQMEVLTMIAVMSRDEDYDICVDEILSQEEEVGSTKTTGVLKVSRLSHTSLDGLVIGEKNIEAAQMYDECPMLGKYDLSDFPCWFCGDKCTQHWEKQEGSSLFEDTPALSPKKRLSDASSACSDIKPKRRRKSSSKAAPKKAKGTNPPIMNLFENISNSLKRKMKPDTPPQQYSDVKEDQSQQENSPLAELGMSGSEMQVQDEEDAAAVIVTLQKQVEALKEEKETQIASLKAEKEAAVIRGDSLEKEYKNVMRRADNRFVQEMALRRQWNTRSADFEKRLDELTATLEESTKKLEDTNLILSGGSCTMTLQELASVRKTLVAGLLNNSTYEEQVRSLADEPESGFLGSKCMVCLMPKADVVLNPCGHASLCESDALKLKVNGQLKKCPYCQQDVESTTKIRKVM